MKLNMLLLIFFVLISLKTGAQESEISNISFGPVVLGENRIPISKDDVKITTTIKDIKFDLDLKTKTLQWIRTNKILLMPRMEVALTLSTDPRRVSARYQNRSILFQAINKNKADAQFFISLFKTEPIEIYVSGKKVGSILVEMKKNATKKSKHLIDYSCAPYKIDVRGLDNDFFSAGCMLVRKGSFGKETGSVQVHWIAPNYRLLDDNPPPYVSILNDNHSVYATLKNRHTGEIKLVRINARIPKRLHRLNTALGFGPYQFETATPNGKWGPKIVSPLFFYANLYLTEGTSIRGFNAFVMNKSFFNNFGIYFAYDVGSALDNRFKIIPLLGFQGLRFFHYPDRTSYTSFIYPQGFEVIYKHAFGLKNYSLVYGMFFSPDNKRQYDNLWLRFGRKVFFELNYIGFERKEYGDYAKTWGLSVGIPFVSFF